MSYPVSTDTFHHFGVFSPVLREVPHEMVRPIVNRTWTSRAYAVLMNSVEFFGGVLQCHRTFHRITAITITPAITNPVMSTSR